MMWVKHAYLTSLLAIRRVWLESVLFAEAYQSKHFFITNTVIKFTVKIINIIAIIDLT